MPPSLARKQFNIEVERIVRELNGIECKQWDQVKADKTQIFSTRSLGERVTDLDVLLQALSKHVGIAAQKARSQGSSCKTMLIFAQNSSYDEQSAGFKSIIHFPCATNSTIEMTQAMTEEARKLFRHGIRYYRVGVGLLDLRSDKHQQFDLFNQSDANPALMATLDGINTRYGRDTLFLAAQGIEQKWDMRREFLTPEYTTKWNNLPMIRC